MLDQRMAANIRENGLALSAAEAQWRAKLIQQEFGFRVADRAEYALIASCFCPSLVPLAMKAFGELLRHFAVDYTLLPKEYRCGAPLLERAHGEQSEEELSDAQVLVKEYTWNQANP